MFRPEEAVGVVGVGWEAAAVPAVVEFAPPFCWDVVFVVGPPVEVCWFEVMEVGRRFRRAEAWKAVVRGWCGSCVGSVDC